MKRWRGVPCETRQHLRDGLTDFERILPGADRMYPDTDHPPVKLTRDRVERIRSQLSEPTFAVEERFEKLGLPWDTIKDLALFRSYRPYRYPCKRGAKYEDRGSFAWSDDEKPP